MNYEELFQKIDKWAHERGIDHADPRVEFMKMAEELGELSSAYNKENQAKLIDSIGDLQIALLIFCKLVGVDHQLIKKLQSERVRQLLMGYSSKKVTLDQEIKRRNSCEIYFVEH